MLHIIMTLHFVVDVLNVKWNKTPLKSSICCQLKMSVFFFMASLRTERNYTLALMDALVRQGLDYCAFFSMPMNKWTTCVQSIVMTAAMQFCNLFATLLPTIALSPPNVYNQTVFNYLNGNISVFVCLFRRLALKSSIVYLSSKASSSLLSLQIISYPFHYEPLKLTHTPASTSVDADAMQHN